HF
ncbi:hypothetical protein D047_0135B, partial [Vibrio parahaemolyticus VPTS-2010_2]